MYVCMYVCVCMVCVLYVCVFDVCVTSVRVCVCVCVYMCTRVCVCVSVASLIKFGHDFIVLWLYSISPFYIPRALDNNKYLSYL